MRSPRPRGERRAAVRAAGRERILAAAKTLFAERGFAGCRIVDIARLAGMSPANVYWHFDSKEAVLAAVVGDGLARLEAIDLEVADSYGPARRKLELLVGRTEASHREDRELVAVLAGLRGPGGRALLDSLGIDVAAVERRRQGAVRRVLAEARSEGAIAPGDPDALATLFRSFFDGLAASPDGSSRLSAEAVRDAALRLLGSRAPR